MDPKDVIDRDRTITVLLLENGIVIGPFSNKAEAREYKASALPNTPAQPVQCIPPC